MHRSLASNLSGSLSTYLLILPKAAISMHAQAKAEWFLFGIELAAFWHSHLGSKCERRLAMSLHIMHSATNSGSIQPTPLLVGGRLARQAWDDIHIFPFAVGVANQVSLDNHHWHCVCLLRWRWTKTTPKPKQLRCDERHNFSCCHGQRHLQCFRHNGPQSQILKQWAKMTFSKLWTMVTTSPTTKWGQVLQFVCHLHLRKNSKNKTVNVWSAEQDVLWNVIRIWQTPPPKREGMISSKSWQSFGSVPWGLSFLWFSWFLQSIAWSSAFCAAATKGKQLVGGKLRVAQGFINANLMIHPWMVPNLVVIFCTTSAVEQREEMEGKNCVGSDVAKTTNFKEMRSPASHPFPNFSSTALRTLVRVRIFWVSVDWLAYVM